ncbi:MAG: hypothetical protein WD906_05190 [Anaerolineales bacterium]
MLEPNPRPESDRLSALAALLLIAFGLSRFAFLPPLGIQIPLLGLLISIEVNSRTVMMLLTAGVAVSGCAGVLRTHPSASRAQPITWLLPGLAALSFGDALARLPFGIGWWAGLLLATAVVLGSIRLEYILLDPQDPRVPFAASALAGAAFLILAVGLFDARASGTRAVFLFPLVTVATAAVVSRVLLLDSGGWPGARYPAAVGGTTAELALGLHYWPIHPIQVSILLTLWAYLGVVLIRDLRGQQFGWRSAAEVGALAAVVVALTSFLAK